MTNLWICIHALCPAWKLPGNNGSNSTRKFAHSLKFEVFEIISLKIGLVFSTMEHDTPELFCCLARDCNYRDEELCDVNFRTALCCTRQNIVFKALGHFGSFLKLYMYIQIKTFMCTITSHKIKKKVKYQTEILSRIAKTAILIKRSNYKLSFQRKTHPQTVDTDNQTFNYDNADGHSQTGNLKNIGK